MGYKQFNKIHQEVLKTIELNGVIEGVDFYKQNKLSNNSKT